MQDRPDWVACVDFDKANARLPQLIDNVVENSCGYCKSFKIINHPILVVLGGEPLALSGESAVRFSYISRKISIALSNNFTGRSI